MPAAGGSPENGHSGNWNGWWRVVVLGAAGVILGSAAWDLLAAVGQHVSIAFH
ncbi:hypothetical protein ACEZCY_30880 [Streptacidiphilus sp. N1-12]|uniref:Uncharacterized protein n=2 Tax=Streptacidiphilus alkalitolerans TaxID=3342712 RepID=A0ABV6WNM5_9ACTN